MSKKKFEIKENELQELNPVTVGELKKVKGTSPILVILFFALFIGFVIYLPYIVNFIKGDSEIKEDFSTDTTDTEDETDNEESNKSTKILTCKLDNATYIYTLDDTLTNVNLKMEFLSSSDKYAIDLLRYQALANEYNNLEEITSSVGLDENGFVFSCDVTYPDADTSKLTDYNFFDKDATYDTIKTAMNEKGYTCS